MQWEKLYSALAATRRTPCTRSARALRSARRWADRIRAAEIILDRLHGEPTQPIADVPAVDVSKLTDDELMHAGPRYVPVVEAPMPPLTLRPCSTVPSPSSSGSHSATRTSRKKNAGPLRIKILDGPTCDG